MTEVRLERAQARRIAVRAQLLDARPQTDLLDVVDQLTFVQLEPTAAVAPTADLVLWSRLGERYEPDDLRAAVERDNALFELDLMVRPTRDLALFRAEMLEWPPYESTRRWLDDNDEFRIDVLTRLDQDGPLTAKQIPDSSIVAWPSSGWNNDRNVMMMLECLSKRGEIGVAGRRGRDRLWDLAERVYHSDIEALPLAEAKRIRDERRLRAQGIVPLKTPDLPAETTRIGDAGVPATIDGVKGAWRVDADALEWSISGEPFEGRTALLSPFDGLIRDRTRMAELFEFDYALEMYKPEAKRRWGYYALPILHGDRLIGKLDATAKRRDATLVVHAIHQDAPFAPYGPEIAEAVDAEIDALAAWLGLERVGVRLL